MALSDRQTIFANYLLQQLGFKDEGLRSEFLTHLTTLYAVYSRIITHKLVRIGQRKIIHPVETLNVDSSSCIDVLLREVKLKLKKRNIKRREFDNSTEIKATDFEKFVYCPASYALDKTFVIDIAKSAKVGLELHNEHFLLKKGKVNERVKEYSTNTALTVIKNSKLVFCGHDSDYRVFRNIAENFVGCPDYIFQDADGKYFVVEEKFQHTKDPKRGYYGDQDHVNQVTNTLQTRFYNSHKVQLITYIRNILEYNIEYGYLIYWHYDYKESTAHIHETGIIKVEMTDKEESFYQKVKMNIEKIKRTGQLDFNKNIRPFKCVKCVTSEYCSHKTGLFNQVKLPYALDDIKVYSVDFPEDLKNKKY